MGKLTSMHFYGWKKGLKTGMYYLRTQAAAAAIQFTVDKAALAEEDAKAVATPRRVNRKRTAPAGMTGMPSGNTGLGRYSSVKNTPVATPREEKVEVVVREKEKLEEVAKVVEKVEKEAEKEEAKEVEGEKKEEVVEEEGEKKELVLGDIYADAVLQCSIENKEACMSCSG